MNGDADDDEDALETQVFDYFNVFDHDGDGCMGYPEMKDMWSSVLEVDLSRAAYDELCIAMHLEPADGFCEGKMVLLLANRPDLADQLRRGFAPLVGKVGTDDDFGEGGHLQPASSSAC